MSKNHQSQTKEAFIPNLGFIKEGVKAGGILFFTSHYYPGFSLLTGLALPSLGGKTMNEKASLAIGEAFGFFILPTIAMNHPLITASLATAVVCYYYPDEIWASTIGKIQDYFSPTEIE